MSCRYKNECPSYSGWCEGPKQDFSKCISFLINAYENEKERNRILNERMTKMNIITAIENYEKKPGDILCFLAGGITNCPDWQKEVIKKLEEYQANNLVVFNPRRENFPIHDPSASVEQIKWEFNQLERMDIFSMYFSSGESVQPICMYELGRNLARMEMRFPNDFKDRIVISVEDGYSRKQDVGIQTKLALGSWQYVHYGAKPEFHAAHIMDAYEKVKNYEI